MSELAHTISPSINCNTVPSKEQVQDQSNSDQSSRQTNGQVDWSNIAPITPANQHLSPAHRHALWWLEQGFWPVPLWPIGEGAKGDGKAPLAGTGWGKIIPTKEFLDEQYKVHPRAGLGLKLGDPRRRDPVLGELTGDGSKWLVDLDIDDPILAAPVIQRMFPDGIPQGTLGYDSNRGSHHSFLGDERLAKYGKRIIHGYIDEKTGLPAGDIEYLGIELRIGTYDPDDPKQLQSAIPPSLRGDGTPREWVGTQLLPLPQSVFDDLDKYVTPDRKSASARKGASKPGKGASKPGLGSGNGKTTRYDRNLVRDRITDDPDRVLEVLDELRVRRTGGMTSQGWLECHAIGRADHKPSAGISPHLVYHDFGNGTKLSLFDLAVRQRPDLYPTWQDAVNAWGERYGVPPSRNGDGGGACTPGRDPRRIANAIVAELAAEQGLPVVAYYGERWWEYVGPAVGGPVWRASPTWDKVGLMNLLNAEADRVYAAELAAQSRRPPMPMNTARLISDVKAQLYPALVVGLWDDPARPFWTSAESGDPDPSLVIALRNGLLDVGDPAAPRLLAPTPRYFSPCTLPFDYDPAAPRPAVFLDKLLARQWKDDPESISTLQEWYGYCLGRDASLQKMLLLYGEPASGKGTIAWVLRLLLGEVNCSEVDSKALSDSHGTEDLPGKLLITFSDSRTADTGDNLAMLQFLLQVVGGDPVAINPKGLRRYTARLTAKVVMLCNVMPHLRDSSGAMDRRYLLLHVPHNVPEEEQDEHLLKNITAELPGILNWALEGRARLLARRRFVQPKSGLPALEQARADANHLIPFIEECCDLEPALSTSIDRLRPVYTAWCFLRGFTEYGPASFGRCLKDAARVLGHPLTSDRPNDPNNRNRKLPTVYYGIASRPDRR